MCSKNKQIAEEIAKDKVGLMMEIVVDKDKVQVRCKPGKKSIKEIVIPFNN